MSGQVNLLPPEIRQTQQTRRTSLMVLLAGAVLLALVLAFYLLQVQRLSSVNGDIEAQQATNAGLQSDIAELQKYEDLQNEAQQKEELLAIAYANEVAFSGLMMDLSRITPSDSYLDSISVTIQPPAAADGTTTTPTPVFVGSLSLSGQTIGVDTISTWLTRLEQIKGWVNPWFSSVSREGPTSNIYTFSGTVDLTDEVRTARGAGQVAAGG
jgi:Tfp pilus assembly protein PilN